MDHDSAPPRPPARRQPPISAHPWFAALVALWFAALLGLGCLALAPAVLERLVAAAGIDRMVPAAAPPLGQTARALLALALAGLGGALGLALGLGLAKRPAGWTGDGVDPVREAESAKPGSRAPEAQAFPRPSLVDRLVGLAGTGEGPRDFADLPQLRARDRHPDAPARKPLSPADAFDSAADSAFAMAADAESLECIDARIAASDPPEAPAPVGETAQPPATAPETFAEPVRAAPPPPLLPTRTAGHSAVAAASLESLGVVQLTERLAIALQLRRERDAQRGFAPPPRLAFARDRAHPGAAAPSNPLDPGRFDAADDDAAFSEDEAAEDEAYSSLLDMAPSPLRHEAVRIEETEAGEAEPAVVFPGQAARAALPPFAASSRPAGDPGATEQALKEALASLQRLSRSR